MDIDFQINWRFEVNKPHKTKNRIFHWIREELLQTVSPEVSVMNWSYSKQWIRFQWRTGRDRILLRGQFEIWRKNFPRFMYRYRNNTRLQEAFTGKIVVAFVFSFSISSIEFIIQFVINTKRTTSHNNKRNKKKLHVSRKISLRFSFRFSFANWLLLAKAFPLIQNKLPCSN